jgi:hypothetical protein
MIMIERSARLSQPVRWTRAGRLAVSALIACAVASALALVVYAAAGGFSASAGRGCIEVTFASTTGGASLHACGARAQRLCASAAAQRGIAESLRTACARAGYRGGAR